MRISRRQARQAAQFVRVDEDEEAMTRAVECVITVASLSDKDISVYG